MGPVRCILVVLLAALAAPGLAPAEPAADSDSSRSERSAAPLASSRVGGLAIPADQALGFVAFPEGDVFAELIADPKAVHSYTSYVRGTSTSALGTDLASVGIGDRFPLMRWGGPARGDGLQLGLEAGAFAQFDFRRPSFDLVNTDYVVGLPITWRLGPFSDRVRIYHQSSHLGDEYLLRARIQRENFAFEALEELVSWDFRFLRAYGGGELVFDEEPEGIVTHLVHVGAEIRPLAPLLRLGREAALKLLAGVDAKATESLDWRPGISARAGFEIANTPESGHITRRWGVLAEAYHGPSPYGQFFRSDVKWYGVGLHFSP